MEAVDHGDDLVGTIAVFLSPFAGELDRSFDRFRPLLVKKARCKPLWRAISSARRIIGSL
jgi:hypothetical protein